MSGGLWSQVWCEYGKEKIEVTDNRRQVFSSSQK